MTYSRPPLSPIVRRVSLWAILMAVPVQAAPPDRATRFDGSSRVEFTDHPAFRPTDDLTIEAWVRRESASRCETIVSKNFRDSWWLGFCPRLRLYTAASRFIDADRDVPAGQWCHIAVTVDGQGVTRFFIDGEPAGEGLLPSIAHNDGPLTVGADVAGGFTFLGSIDELLDREIFDTLWEAKILIESWRHEYNTFRPHSSLGYRPPAPEALELTPKSPGTASRLIPEAAPTL